MPSLYLMNGISMFKKDNIFIGILIGISLPLLTYCLFAFLKTKMTLYAKDSFLHIMCIGTNALIFRYFIKKEKDQLAKGVLAVTFIYAMIFFWWKFSNA